MRFCSWNCVQLSFPSPRACLRRAPAGFWGAEGPACSPARARGGAGVSCCLAGTVLAHVVEFPLCLGWLCHSLQVIHCRELPSLSQGNTRIFAPVGSSWSRSWSHLSGTCPHGLSIWPPSQSLTPMVFNHSVSGKGKTRRRKPYRLRWRMTVSSVTCGGRAMCLWS